MQTPLMNQNEINQTEVEKQQIYEAALKKKKRLRKRSKPYLSEQDELIENKKVPRSIGGAITKGIIFKYSKNILDDHSAHKDLFKKETTPYASSLDYNYQFNNNLAN